LLGLGCYAGPARVGYAVSYGEPPPPPAYYYVPAARDGYVWVDGRWDWTYDQWAWRPGYWITARPNYVYVQGGWYGGRYQTGYWQPSQGQTYVRDHRSYGSNVVVPSAQTYRSAPVQTYRPTPAARPVPRNGQGETVRDHRH
jgi:hypothetical protein